MSTMSIQLRRKPSASMASASLARCPDDDAPRPTNPDRRCVFVSERDGSWALSSSMTVSTDTPRRFASAWRRSSASAGRSSVTVMNTIVCIRTARSTWMGPVATTHLNTPAPRVSSSGVATQGSSPGRAEVHRRGFFDSFDFVGKRRHRKRTGGRTTPKGTRPADFRHRRPQDVDPGSVPELVAGIRLLLAAPTPFELLVQASGFVEVATERPMDRLGPERMGRVDGAELVGSLIDSDWPELKVLRRAIATLMPDRPVVRRLRILRVGQRCCPSVRHR